MTQDKIFAEKILLLHHIMILPWYSAQIFDWKKKSTAGTASYLTRDWSKV